MLSDKLKEETQNNHQLLEKVLVGQLKAIRTPHEYVNLLKTFYSYFGGLEKRINEVIDTRLLPDNVERRKTQAIANDIANLGGEVSLMASADDLPAINTHLEALGALYVIEGSTLGGKIISKMMQQQLGADKGMTFFAGYGDKTGQMWDTFKDALNGQPQNTEQEAVVIAAANQTFLKFGEWFDKTNQRVPIDLAS
ncbi:biliverdin-producing heme oxygenase [Mucilaginibacter phyllosphaerae]|uniref:Heme oxygenase n=1 Tax=Mucilaginibacter phyllosphaerae TaxID=1812349 RepID=A0A4Y8AEX9_9SPHI|nr:biliverdin-producing heme oxygenase [Mucilaginibacter phyllosphaerae]MBB3970208.1 heme oxygenase [Mucilaginibacter phyllosphaerae]TEW66589.1 heme oxygenase [Mucilaginibacter phyllosphaerae]GGH10530.1 heme oxygenase [Mucilaginibacter phyllosphaerae]